MPERADLDAAAAVRAWHPKAADGCASDRQPTCLQDAQNSLRDLVQAVIDSLDDDEAAAWFEYLIETAAVHGRRAQGA